MFTLKLEPCAVEVDEQNKALLCGRCGSQERRILRLRQLEVLPDTLNPPLSSFGYLFLILLLLCIVRRRPSPAAHLTGQNRREPDSVKVQLGTTNTNQRLNRWVISFMVDPLTE